MGEAPAAIAGASPWTPLSSVILTLRAHHLFRDLLFKCPGD